MSNIIFICEGPSEKNLIELVLKPYWKNKGLTITTNVIILGEGNPKCNGSGGCVSFERLKTDLDYAMRNGPESYITTVFDFYELRKSWPGQNLLTPAMTSKETVETIEKVVKSDLIAQFNSYPVREKVIPYLMLHEYEGLFFTKPSAITNVTKARRATTALEKILDDFANKPEEINTTLAPSTRMKIAGANYGKTTHAHRIANTIGVDAIRVACPHFNDWMNVLEALR